MTEGLKYRAYIKNRSLLLIKTAKIYVFATSLSIRFVCVYIVWFCLDCWRRVLCLMPNGHAIRH